MLELFNQYVLIHCTAFNVHHQDLLLQITGDGYAMISSDFFTFGGEYDDVLRAYLGNKIGYGLLLKQPILINPIPLTAMRNCGILPPQGMVYLKSETVKKLMFPV